MSFSFQSLFLTSFSFQSLFLVSFSFQSLFLGQSLFPFSCLRRSQEVMLALGGGDPRVVRGPMS